MTSEKNDIFIFDIDGTLANTDGLRGPFEEHKVYGDKVVEPVAAVLRSLVAYHYPIIFVSGRTETCRELTHNWIIDKIFNGDKRYITLLMRKTGDHRNDAIVKKEIYDTQITPHYNILGVFDDRLRVYRMLYENNIFCFNVNQGLKEF
jgi:hypothetical protein